MKTQPSSFQADRLPSKRRSRAILLASLTVCFLGACAEQRIRDQSREAAAVGQYEQALQGLEAGLKVHTESVTLRTALLQTRAEALTQFVAHAGQLRGQGKLEEAEAELRRAQKLEPQNRRLSGLIADLGVERRQKTALADAEKLVARNQPEVALRLVEESLKDNPRHEGLLLLQRRLEVSAREARLIAAQTTIGETRPITLDFRDANLRTVLDLVTRNSGINFILDKDIRVDTRVTVFIRSASVEDVLDLLLNTNQLAKKVVDPHTVIIYPNTPDKQRDYQDQIIRVFYIGSTEAKGAAAFLKAMLKIRDPFVDERANLIALRESPENIQLAERLISLYDVADSEVMLDVEVLEIGATRLTELGAKFPDSISFGFLPPDGVVGLTLANIRNLGRDRVSVGVSNLLLNLKREVSDYTTLANPQIRARNKEKAKILIGDKVPVVTTTSSSTGFVSESVSYLDVGIKLDVEPAIYSDDDVAIKVALEVSSLGTSIKTNSGTLAYQIGTRNATTVLRLHDGETQLLAGLISRDERTSASRVPGIGDLPVLGRLFSSQQDNSTRTEVVLAITPHIIRNVRRPDTTETELWVGTEAQPRLRPAFRAHTQAGGNTSASANTGEQRSAAGASDAGESNAAVLSAPKFNWQAPSDVKVGEVFEVSVVVRTVAPLRGAPFQLAFAPSKLQFIDVSEGDFFSKDGAATSFSKSGDGKDGRLGVGVLRSQPAAVQGTGVVVRLKFKALAPGPTELQLISANPVSSAAALPPSELPTNLVVQVR